MLSAPDADAFGADAVLPPAEVTEALRARMGVLNADPYLQLVDERLHLISVFDDLKYDRADADMMSPAMRGHAIRKLKPLGFRQVQGTMLEERESGIRVYIPKVDTLGASPFDITRYRPKRRYDFYLLTPTQTACQIIDGYGHDEAVQRIRELVEKHPINLFRLMDYLERKSSHQDFQRAIGHLRYVQRMAVESEPLKRRRALG